jgi:hypothetical protein
MRVDVACQRRIEASFDEADGPIGKHDLWHDVWVTDRVRTQQFREIPGADAALHGDA